ncbi:MAG: hypothetical protein LIP28_08660 [Deltaproteobacteria bacterium]|nr:hypothetical protein [Deltaproteobacteria bacterium]
MERLNAPAPSGRPCFKGLGNGLRASALALLAFFLVSGVARAANDETQIAQSGALPKQGRVVLRSGMAWLDETAPVFYRFSAAFAKELKDRGLTVVTVKASALDPMPKTPIPNKRAAGELSGRSPAREKGPAEGDAARAASEMGKTGRLPKLKLRSYATPERDEDLSESVRAITSPDVTRALYARSQQVGKPVVSSFAIPGRIPKELADDAKIADYAIVIRFAAVQAWAAAPETFPFGPGVLVAASTIGGTGSLGFGAPAQPAPPGRDTYGTPGGYARGYEGWGRNDFWNRDSDFRQRDYQFKHGPPPAYATPPSGLSGSGGGTQQRGFGVGNLPGRAHVSNIGWHLLIMDGFDLAPVRDGKEPAQIWQAVIRTPGDADSLANSLPKMIRAVFAPASR